VIRNAVIHLANEQPLLADLFEMPTSSDVALVCTNLRMLNGQRPIFTDAIDSVFLFPLGHIRFVEIPARSTAAGARAEETALVPAPTGETGPAPEPEPELELDEDLLRRVREV
jgi:hypothetical protein